MSMVRKFSFTNCSEEIRRRLAIGKKVMIDVVRIWRSNIPTTLKARLLRATAFTVATYGAQNKRMGPGEDRQRYDSKIERSAAKATVFRSHHQTYHPRNGHHPRQRDCGEEEDHQHVGWMTSGV